MCRYTFDCTLHALIQVRAPTEEEARRILGETDVVLRIARDDTPEYMTDLDLPVEVVSADFDESLPDLESVIS